MDGRSTEGIWRPILTNSGLCSIQRNNLTQAQLARILNVSDKTVSKLIPSKGSMTDRYAAEVRSDEMEARAGNVQGVPFFVIDDKYAIPGALPIEQMENILRKLKLSGGGSPDTLTKSRSGSHFGTLFIGNYCFNSALPLQHCVCGGVFLKGIFSDLNASPTYI